MDDKVTFSEKFKQRLPLLSAVALEVAVLLAVVIIVCLLRLAFFWLIESDDIDDLVHRP